jgi:hypothetical protein
MVAVPEMPLSEPVAIAATGRVFVPTSTRAVAVTPRPAELLRPGSDLARLVAGFPEVELLVAADDDGEWGDPDDDDLDRASDELRACARVLALPGLRLHRLGLPSPLPAGAEDDLVAALSELVGFDPEPGVYCLAPAANGADPAGSAEPRDPAHGVVNRAAERVAQVYGIPLMRYRRVEFEVTCSSCA